MPPSLTLGKRPFSNRDRDPVLNTPAWQEIGEKRHAAPSGGHPRLGHLPATLTPGKRGAYPGTGSGQGLPEGLKRHLLVMAHKLSQVAVAVGVPRDQVAPVLELGDDEVAAAVAAPATQTGLTPGRGVPPGGCHPTATLGGWVAVRGRERGSWDTHSLCWGVREGRAGQGSGETHPARCKS